MIVVDSSVFIAILEQEPEAERFLSIIRDATRRLASAVTVYETGIVINVRHGRQSADEMMTFLAELGVEIVPFAEPYISQSLDAYSRFGKGIDQGATEPRRLCGLCTGERSKCTAVVQGGRFFADGCSAIRLTSPRQWAAVRLRSPRELINRFADAPSCRGRVDPSESAYSSAAPGVCRSMK